MYKTIIATTKTLIRNDNRYLEDANTNHNIHSLNVKRGDNENLTFDNENLASDNET